MTSAISGNAEAQAGVEVDRYSRPAMVMHWLTLGLVVGAYLAVNIRGNFSRGSDARELAGEIHYTLGLMVLAVALCRLVWRFMAGSPKPMASWPPYLVWSSRLVEWALYAFIVLQPIMGLLAVNALGHFVVAGGVVLPVVIGPSQDLGRSLEAWHILVGNAFYFVIGLHAAAALFHQYVLRDGTLSRMGWPRR